MRNNKYGEKLKEAASTPHPTHPRPCYLLTYLLTYLLRPIHILTTCLPSVDCQKFLCSSDHILTSSTDIVQLVVLAVVAPLKPL